MRAEHPPRLHRMRAWIDLLLMSLTFFLTIIWNVEIGIAVSVVISLLLVVHRSSRPRMTILVSPLPPPTGNAKRDRHRFFFHRAASRARTGGNPSTKTQRRRKTRRACSSCASARTSTSVRRLPFLGVHMRPYLRDPPHHPPASDPPHLTPRSTPHRSEHGAAERWAFLRCAVS